MTLRPLPRSRLNGLVPSLVQEHALVALVAGTGDERWAADAAWAVARAAYTSGRRVALVDLSIADPQLHAPAGVAPDAPGIVDVFAHNGELTMAAHDVGGVFFIPAGTPTAAPEFVLAHPRWQKLHAGFRAEGALLLVYLSPGALASLSSVPDGIIVLAPGGFDLEAPVAREVRAAQVDGANLLGVVRDRWTPGPMPAPPGVHFPIALHNNEAPPMPGRSRAARAAGGAIVVAAAVGIAALVWNLLDHPFRDTAAATSDTARVGAASAAATPITPAPPATMPVDTLAWVVQVAAYANVENALAHADRIRNDGVVALVSPVIPAGGAVVWYRVLVGGWVNEAAASAGRDTLWNRGLAPRGEGEVLRAPFTLAITGNQTADALRAQGIPALPAGGRLVAGAFESAEQAAHARELLTRAGVPAALTLRVEQRP